jgi:hypothetical protein
MHEQMSGFVTLKELTDWIDNDYAIAEESGNIEDKKESIINFVDTKGITLEELNDTLEEYKNDVDVFTKDFIDSVLFTISEEFEVSESFVQYPSLEQFLNEAKKKPKTKEGKEKKFAKVMKEFGHGELTPYHTDKPLKPKKEGGTKKDIKQSLAIAFSEAGVSKKKKRKMNEEFSSSITIEELVDWADNEYALCLDKDVACKKEAIINFIDKQGITLEELYDAINEYHDNVDHFTKGVIDDIIITIELEFELDESLNELSYDKFDYEQELYHEIKGIINDSWTTKLDNGQIGNILIKLGKRYLSDM